MAPPRCQNQAGRGPQVRQTVIRCSVATSAATEGRSQKVRVRWIGGGRSAPTPRSSTSSGRNLTQARAKTSWTVIGRRVEMGASCRSRAARNNPV